MSSERFLQLKHALEETDQTTFVIGDAVERTSCMVYKHGDCNFIYGFRIQCDFEIPQLGTADKPRLIAISDDKGRDIAIVDKFTFINITEGYTLDAEVEPYYIDNQVAAMNERLASTYVTDFRDALTLDDFDENTANTIQQSAKSLARHAAVDGTAIDCYCKIVNDDKYLAIRSGTLDEKLIAQEFCEEHKISLMVERLSEEMLEQGMLNEIEAALAEMLRNLNDSVRAITLNFERGEEKASSKVEPAALRKALVENSAFSIYSLKDYGLATMLMPSINEKPLNIYDIESVTYGAKTLYVRDDGGAKENVKENKRANIYER